MGSALGSAMGTGYRVQGSTMGSAMGSSMGPACGGSMGSSNWRSDPWPPPTNATGFSHARGGDAAGLSPLLRTPAPPPRGGSVEFRQLHTVYKFICVMWPLQKQGKTIGAKVLEHQAYMVSQE